MFGLFAKKVVCFQCDRKAPKNEASFRRGFYFCSDACEQAFVADNSLRPLDGDETSWPAQARQHLELASAEMRNIVRMAGGRSAAGGGAVGIGMSIQNVEEVKDAFARYNAHLLNALPFLYGLGLDSECTALERCNLEEIYDLSPNRNMWRQMRRIRGLCEPVLLLIGEVESSIRS